MLGCNALTAGRAEQPAYSSAYNVNEEKLDHAAGCAILPVKRSRGPAPPMPAGAYMFRARACSCVWMTVQLLLGLARCCRLWGR